MSDDYKVITIRMKDKPWITKSFLKKYIKDQFDENTMEIIPEVKKSKEEEKKYYEDLSKQYKTTGGPAIVISGKNSRPSTTYNGKLDAGATENLLDMGLEGAKKRALQRNKKFGSSFRKVKNLKGRKKK